MGSICRPRPGAGRRPLSSEPRLPRDLSWRILERREIPEVLHREQPDPADRRLACVCLPLTPAVVIGSAQAESDFDVGHLAAAGLGLVRRRSGGGAVLVAPAAQLWLDVFVPSGDPLSEPDAGKSFYWLGEVFARSIAAVLEVPAAPAGIVVHRGPPRTTAWSKVLCYSGLGAGEVTVGGRKVVGMSQRRDRSGAWIQSMAMLAGGADSLAELLTGSEKLRASARIALSHSGLPAPADILGSLGEAVLSRLP